MTASSAGSSGDGWAAGPRVVTVSELLAGAQDVRPLDDAPGKSGARLDRLRIDGVDLVAKYLEPATDWTVRASGVLGGPMAALWTSGILQHLPDCLNQPIVGVAVDARPDAACPLGAPSCSCTTSAPTSSRPPTTRSPRPPTSDCSSTWPRCTLPSGVAAAEIEVVPVMHRYLELSPWTAMAESAIGSTHLVPQLIGRGWPLLEQVAPAAAAVVTPLAWDPGPLVAALETTPQTFVHGNWKLDNLGTDPAGRTIVLDWEMPGRGAPLSDLAWYLAINCRRLPQAKESAIDAYRGALEDRGVDTGPWWDRQLALSLLGALVQFGWEKALGGYDDELAWWEEKALAGARVLSR